MNKYGLEEILKSSDYPDQVKKYFKKFGIYKWEIELDRLSKYDVITVVPAIAEFENLQKLISSLKGNKYPENFDVLVIFVINNSDSCHRRIFDENQKTIRYLWELIEEVSLFQIAIVDASSADSAIVEIDAGVGIARKIGADFALLLLKNLKRSVISYLDADCTVTGNYFETLIEISKQGQEASGFFSFKHRTNSDEILDDAIISYEIFLRYYVLALKYSGSPYSFHTIGSTIFFNPLVYIKIGGMNKRKAGEDFYFTQKLAKIVGFNEIKEAQIYPDSRSSWRVPFGTGKALTSMKEKSSINYELYDIKNFDILKLWLEILESPFNKNAEEILEQSKSVSVELSEFLAMNDFANSFNKIANNSKSATQLSFQKKIWFDGFKTFKLIHFLRDKIYPNRPMFEMIDELLVRCKIDKSFERKDEIPSKEVRLQYLEILRKHG
ncbi:MAG: hypothetical protein K9J12_15975 [Melioribacteraceae bacterium]|nr:hypothetical protein [Melioribacteraceae bacterium]MCF8431394.1 hypothetical protein [Melioribacteraceae bacterium]